MKYHSQLSILLALQGKGRILKWPDKTPLMLSGFCQNHHHITIIIIIVIIIMISAFHQHHPLQNLCYLALLIRTHVGPTFLVS